MQKHFVRYGLQNFIFKVVAYECDLKKRLNLEKKLIENTAPNCIFNPLKPHNFKTNPRVSQRVTINKIVYDSIAEASRKLNRSSRSIGLKLDDALNTHYERLDYHEGFYFDTYKVQIHNQIFESTQAVVKEGLANTTRQVRDRC